MKKIRMSARILASLGSASRRRPQVTCKRAFISGKRVIVACKRTYKYSLSSIFIP